MTTSTQPPLSISRLIGALRTLWQPLADALEACRLASLLRAVAGHSLPRLNPVAWGAVAVMAGTLLPAPGVPVVQEWFVPQPEAQLREDYLVLAPSTNTICDSVIAVTVPIADTKIVLDHWEDGYEVDLGNPVQATSQIWGDGNNANGKPPGYANDPASFAAGSVIIMRNNVTLPRNAATILYDGRDRFGSTHGIVMTRAGWFTAPGSVLANSVEVRAIPDWGTSFVLPVGEDVIFPTPLTSSMFEHCSAYLMAAANGTVVTIDKDGDGSGAAITVTLNQGESYLINAGLKKGATITATKGIQVIEFFGDIGGNYESRGANIPPLGKWSDDYYAPVGTASDGDDTYVFLYNPDAAAITVNATTKTGTSSFSIPAKSTYQYLMPQDSAAHFISVGGKPFWGIGTVGAEPTANNVHDWGYSLVPKSFLSTEIVVGWGAGSTDPAVDGNPVWVTAAGDTTIYVDYNGDHAGSLTDPNGNAYDIAYAVTPLTVTRIYEPDKDQTAMRLYTLNGVKMTGAWGQDPAVAGAGLPFLDLGNTLPNFPVPLMTKTSRIVTDVNSNGVPNPGDTMEYTITLDNRTLFSLSAVPMEDVLPTSYVTYVSGSTTRDGGGVADAGSTAFPLDEGGLVVPILQANASTVVTFRVTINAGVSGTVVNSARVPGMLGVGAVDSFVVPTAGGGGTACTLKLTNSIGSEVNYLAGEGIYVTVTDADANTSATVAESLTALVANSTTGDAELITLVETGINTGIFRNAAPLPSSTSTGLGTNDGTLNVQVGNTITATHVDAVFGDTCPDDATIAAPASPGKQLYLSDPAQALDRVDPVNVSPADTTTSQTAELSGSSGGTVTFDAATTNTGTATSITVSHTTGTGSNRLMLISAGNFNGATVSSVTVNGVALVAGTNRVGTASGVDIWKVLNPTSGTYNIVVTFSAAMDKGACVGVTTFSGVDQTTALGSFISASGSGSATVNVVSAVGDLVFSSVTCEGGAAPTLGGSGQTARWALGTTGAAYGGSTKPATTTSTTMAWTHAGSCTVAGIAIKPAITIVTATASFTQAPAFAEAFSLTAAPTLTAYYTVNSGTMPASPSITAVLKKNGTQFATSSSASAAGGLLTFTFPALGSPVGFVTTDYISVDITSIQSGVSFTIDYDSNTKPSKITLPTNTVIHTDSVTIYDAPYPGGSVVTTPVAVGQTLYVRVVVGDPFGAADITSVPLVIDGTGSAGDIATTLTAANVVHTATATKTYEYVWTTGSTEGNFNVTATAKEGYEGTITAARSTTATLTALDLGTPSITEFTATSNGTGTTTYAGNATVYVRVTDLDQNTNPLVAETITVTVISSSGDSETITLTETGDNTGIFVGSVPANASTNSVGTLYARLGDALVVNYVDPTDATDTSSDNAAVPNTVAAVSVEKTLLAPADGQIVLGETAQFRLRVTNTGNTTLATVQVVDTYPSASLEYVTATLAPNSTTAGTLTWTNVGPLSSGQSVDIVVDFTGKAAANPATNSVNVTTGGGPTASSSANVIITRPAVTVTKTLDASTPGPLTKGNNATFNISVQNTGSSVIDSLPLEDLFSGAIFEYVSATITPDGVGAGSLLWNDLTGAGSLAVNATVSLSVTLKVKGAANPASNSAAVNYAVDANGDPVPPTSASATVVTTAASISGTVYEDRGVSGFGDDVALPGVTIELYRPGYGPDGVASTADDSDPVGVTTTDATGYYEFLNLALGSYVVIETDPLGYSSIADTQGTGTDNQIAVSVVAATLYAGNNFLDDIVALVDYGTISGQVRNDADASGVISESEPGLGGATLQLYTDPNGDGNPADGVLVQTTTSASTGSVGTYTFSYVAPGSYVVVEVPASGWVSTGDGDTTTDAGGSPADAANIAADSRLAVNLGAGETDNGNDFLETNTSLLAKTVDKSVAGVAETLTYTLSPSFPGPGLLTSATVTDTLPTGTTFGSFGQTGGVSNTPPLTWSLGSNTAAVDGSSLTSANMVSGTYTGDGTDNRDFTSLGFQPALVIIKASTAQNAVARSATLVGDLSKDLNTAAVPAANLIQSLLANGFQVGSDARVNSAGVVYHYVAFKAVAGEIVTGTYTGTGNVLAVTGVGFTPAFLITMGNGARAAGWKTSQMLGGNAGVSYETRSAAQVTNAIRTLDASGFTLDNSGSQNINGDVYNYIAFKAVAGKMQTGTFNGDGTDNRDVTGVGFAPAFAWLRGNATGTSEVVFKGSSTGSNTDATQSMTNIADFTDGIQALQSDGFQVGTSTKVNASTLAATYWAAFKGPTNTTTALAVDQRLVTDPNPASGSIGVNVVVTMTVGSTTGLTGVVPPTLSLTKSLATAATATLVSGPTPATVDIAAGGTATCSWTYRLDVDSAAANWKENLKFSGTPTHANATFGAATSPSVILTQPLTFTATVNNPASAATVTNRASLFNNGSLISLSPSTLTTLLGTIGNRVWADLNGNGLLDNGETGLDGVEVDLYLNGHVPGINPPYATTTTATVGLDAGVYSFTNVAPGNYYIYLPTAPASALQSSTVTNTADDRVDSDDNGSQSVIGGAVTSPVIAIGAGETDNTLDFGFVPNFSLGNKVFGDINNDGHLDPGEPDLVGVRVLLFAASGGAPTGTALQETTTNAHGSYRFDNVVAGTYVVVVDADSTALLGYVTTTGWSTDVTTVLAQLNDHGKDTPVNVGGVAHGIASVAVTLGPGLQPSGEIVGNQPGPGTHGPNGDLSDNLVLDFGFTPTYSIGNRVFLDNGASGGTLANGIQDGGEAGISGVAVQLKSGATVVATTTTDASGFYRFDNLVTGTYTVVLPVSEFASLAPLNGLLSSPGTQAVDLGDKGLDDAAYLTNGLTSAAITVGLGLQPTGESVTGTGAGANGPNGDASDQLRVDFGLVAATGTCSLGSLVWHDANNNGTFTTGESGLAGVIIEVWNSDVGGTLLGTAPVVSTTTTARGTYFVSGLAPGLYRVVIPVSNFTGGGVLSAYPSTSGTPVNSDNQIDDDNNAIQAGGADTAAISPIITLATGAEPTTAETGTGGSQDDAGGFVDANGDMTLDFGFYSPSGYQATLCSLGSFVWNDADNDGSFDSGEAGIAGVTLQLYQNVSGTWTYYASTVSGADGAYFFHDLPSGSQWKILIPASNFAGGSVLAAYPKTSGTPVNADNQTDSDNNGIQTGGVGTEIWSPAITLTTGAEPTTETGTGGSQDNTGAFVDANGDMTLDFGLVYVATYSLGNHLYRDPDDDGQPDLDNLNEGPIVGASVALFAADGSGNPTGSELAPRAITDSNGFYRFDWLPAGTYVVVVDMASPALALYRTATGASADTSHSGDIYDHGKDTPLGVGSVLPGGIASCSVVLGPGLQPTGEPVGTGLGANGPAGDASDNLVIDFGFTPLFSIGNRVFADANNNGIMDGADAGIAGVKLKLYTADSSGNPLVLVNGTMETDASGYYRFDGLPVNTYVVVVDKAGSASLAGYASSTGASTDTRLTGEKTDHGVDTPLGGGSLLPGGIVSTPVVMVAFGVVAALHEPDVATGLGSHGPNTDDSDCLVMDFGFRQLGSVTGSVLAYTFSNTSGDAPLADVALELRDAVTDALIATTTTNASGIFTFSAVEPGTYKVVETQPTGYSSVSDRDTGDLDIIGDVTPLTVTAGVTNSGNHFVEAQYGTITGSVFADTNNDNLGESALGGVTVTLWTDPNGDGDPVDGAPYGSPTTTAGDGSYTFPDVVSGTYVIVQTDLSGYLSVADGDSISDTVGSPDDAANASQTDNYLPVNLRTGETDSGNRFVDEQLGSIGDRVWQDYNDNGSQDSGEPGLAGVRVYIDLDADNAFDAGEPAAITNGSGAYLISDLTPDTYTVRVDLTTLPDHTEPSYDLNGGLDHEASVALTAGQNRTDADFGYSCFGTWEEWQFLHPLGTANNPSDDPDSDNYDNLLEYALSQAPDSGIGTPFCIAPSGNTLIGQFTRPLGATQDVTYYIEYKNTLTGVWSSQEITSGMITTQVNADCTETVTINDLETVTALTGEAFVRLRVSLNGALPADLDGTSYSEVKGWTETTLASGCSSYNNPYQRCAIFTGTVDAVNGQILTFTGENLTGLLTSGVKYYLEVTAGDNVGHRFDVDVASDATITLMPDSSLYAAAPPFNTLTTVPASLVGDQVALHRHWTLGELFPVMSFHATADPATADAVQTYTPGVTNPWTTYWLYYDSVGAVARWVSATGSLNDDKGASVLPPGQGLFVNNRGASAVVMAPYGEVRANDFIRPLGAGNNLVGGGFPIDQKARGTGSRVMSLAPTPNSPPAANGFFGSLDFKTADSFFVWRGDANAATSGYDTYYLGGSVSPALDRWIKAGDTTLLDRSSTNFFLSDRSVFIRAKVALPAYKIPSPWTP